MIWPDCYRPIFYTWGPSYSIGYFWPYYHRKFIFVSLGGYWPGYSYRRYYWYGCHPYRWYGYYPPGYVSTANTYNYYYYNTNEPPQDIVNNTGTQLEEETVAEPAQENQTDRLFSQAVNAFENEDYNTAATRFNEAMEFSPDDIVLPFAYVQALFADGQYELAAQNLREALKKSPPDKEGVFYPRGLYPDESILQQQIDTLKRTIILINHSAEMELLLGYQMLGTGKLDEAAGHLEIAASDDKNNEAATLLIKLLEKLKKADEQKTEEVDNSQSPKTAEK
ncbi:MAG: tetratricopeptide repeat protein [Sedimentisphaerales bacterium]|nr:tetratricopeptide repeat protein [Sedimentisphaerales bacterium]